MRQACTFATSGYAGGMKIHRKNFKIALVLAEITRRELARRVGVSNSFIGYLLTGARPIPQKRLAQIAEILGVSERWLLGLDGPEVRS